MSLLTFRVRRVYGSPMPNLDLLSVSQAAAELGITDRAVRHHITRGALHATKLGPGTASYVVARDDLDRFIANRESAA